MKTIETKEQLTETQQKVLDHIQKFNGSSAELIANITQLNKLVIYKSVKVLADKGMIKVNSESDPATYEFLKTDKRETNPSKDVTTETVLKVEEPNKNVLVKKATKTATAKKVEEDEATLPKTSGRDTSKLKFNGELYGKGRLVLAVVKKYVEDNPKTTLTKLKEIFPNELQPRYGVVEEVSKAKKISADRDRFFLKPEDLIKVGDKKIAVCNQFGSHNLPLKHFKSLGFVIK